jgi:peptidoglycan hydrolase-like protein with peptidoglycan-binding domain
MGLTASTEIDDDLLELLSIGDSTAAIRKPVLPDPQPPVPSDSAPRADTVAAGVEEVADTGPDPMIMKIQAGLKAFGNDKMVVDGVIGSQTKAALREFQSLFGLPVTGEPNREVYAKMREIGLTN